MESIHVEFLAAIQYDLENVNIIIDENMKQIEAERNIDEFGGQDSPIKDLTAYYMRTKKFRPALYFPKKVFRNYPQDSEVLVKDIKIVLGLAQMIKSLRSYI